MTQHETYNARQTKALPRVRESLKANSQRQSLQYGRQRQHDRLEFEGYIELVYQIGDLEQRDMVMSYSISQGGVGLILPTQIELTTVRLGMILPNDQRRWMNGRVVRCKAIPEEDLWECGIAFITAPKTPAPQPSEEHPSNTLDQPATTQAEPLAPATA